MAILAFQKPDKVIMLEADDKHGKFEFRPLEQGYGITIGNSLRRILLASLEGYAITTVKIDGVEHEFSTVTGVIEDLTDIILNLKQIRFKQQIEDVSEEKVVVTISGQDEFKAGDLVGVRERSKSMIVITDSLESNRAGSSSWIEWDGAEMTGKFLNRPEREDIPENIKEQLIVELYSK
jgi:hypothetical protein